MSKIIRLTESELIHIIKKVIEEQKIPSTYEKEMFPTGGDKTKAYHLTPDIYLENIKRVGLVPKTENKLEIHPERIYLFLDIDSNYNVLARDLWLSSKNKNQIKHIYLLEIDLTKLPNHRYYFDGESFFGFQGIYTKQPIPPSAMRIVKKMAVNDFPEDKPIESIPRLFNDDPDEIAKDNEVNNKWEELFALADKLGIDKIPS